jgi:hypothetical protein
MRWVKLSLCLALFVPGFALLGAFSTLDSHFPVWWGLTIGAAIAVILGVAFGGAKGRWLDYFFGPEDIQDDPGGRGDG